MEQNTEITGLNRGENGKFLPGFSGNPDGRPKDSFSLLTILKRKLQQVPPEYKNDKKTYAEALVNSILKKGIVDGDHSTQKLIMNYIDGMPKQTISGDPDNPLFVQQIPESIILKNAIPIHAEPTDTSEGNS